MDSYHLLQCEGGISEDEVSHGNNPFTLRDKGGAIAPRFCDNTLRLSDTCPHEDVNILGSKSVDINKKKVSRIVGWGLRRFSKIVCQKVQAKGRTTYNEVADEIIADLATLDNASEFEFDEKNIRRRVYDAFNVLLAINVIAKDKKEIQWMGLPNKNIKALEDLKKQYMHLTNRIHDKEIYLKALEAKAIDIKNLVARNQHLHGSSGTMSSKGVSIPFVLVNTNAKATVEIEISQDMHLVHFNFNGHLQQLGLVVLGPRLRAASGTNPMRHPSLSPGIQKA
ncbi:hypothetical protein HPP92_027879 [Vanilla planifolia]|uniref:Uncharacterized protein n=1 Tax=Vanilla planifolia TaxID=51239 RepID=A0A835P8B3_VANPL|nr:hypothetical protein HPP92_027879 [Vanilla planifolia]